MSEMYRFIGNLPQFVQTKGMGGSVKTGIKLLKCISYVFWGYRVPKRALSQYIVGGENRKWMYHVYLFLKIIY